MPAGVVEQDLARLESLVNSSGAERILILGDLLHAPAGLADGLIETVARWRRRVGVEWELVPGNHDRRVERVAQSWALVVRDAAVVEEGIGFGHDPQSASSAPLMKAAFVWAGHVHPAVHLRGNGDRLSLPCYWIRGRIGVLPAFSVFTGGVGVDLHPPESKAYAIAEGRVFELAGPQRPTRAGPSTRKTARPSSPRRKTV